MDSRLDTLEEAHKDGQRMLYGWADPTAPGGWRKGIITTLSDGLERVGNELTVARADFGKMLGWLRSGARAAWTFVCFCVAATVASLGFIATHLSQITHLLDKVTR